MGLGCESSKVSASIYSELLNSLKRAPIGSKCAKKQAELYVPKPVLYIPSLLMRLVPITADPNIDLEGHAKFGRPHHVLPDLLHDGIHCCVGDLQHEFIVHL